MVLGVISIRAEEENTEDVGTSKTFTGTHKAVAVATRETSLLSTLLPNSNFRSIRILRKQLLNNRKLQMMMVKISSGPQQRIFRLKIKMRPRRRMTRRCRLQVGHLCQKHRTNKTLRNSALPLRLPQKLRPPLQNPRFHRSSMQRQVVPLFRQALNAVYHLDQFRRKRSHPGGTTSASLHLLQLVRSRRL